MERDRWQRVEEVYLWVLACPPGERAAVLDETCSGEADLRREVESLLAAREEAAGDFLSPDDLPDHIAQLSFEIASPAAGTRLGDYELLELLGAGAMGEVYRARDTRLGREVALKILPRQLTSDPVRVARFQAEARAASALNHPNTVTIYEIGKAAGTWFIAAELIDGVTVRERMKSGRLAPEEMLAIALQCAGALEAAHLAGIVHRDIKPENIMIRRDGAVKIIDFGLARIVEPRPEWALDATQTGSVMGTPRYMSPEQARGQKLDARSDIFSLGAVVAEMATGRPAFPGYTTPEVFAALLATEPDLTDAGAWDPTISKALAKDPAARYQTMAEFASDLRNPAPAAIPAGRFKRPLAGRLIRRATVAATFVAAAGVAVYLSVSHRVPNEGPLNLLPLTTSGGTKQYTALSPDGQRVAFSWQPVGTAPRHIYVKPIGPGEATQLTFSNGDDVTPAWSPDGRQIAFCRGAASGDNNFIPHEIYVLPVDGGKERKAAEGWRGVSWSPDGKTLAFAQLPNGAADPARESGGIFALSLETGQHRTLTTGHRDKVPIFSPNGRWVAFVREVSSTASDIFVVSSDGGTIRQLTSDRRQIRGCTWTADSREVVFGSSRNAAGGSLWRVPVTGGPPRPVSATLHDAFDPSISREGHRLVYREEWLDTNLYLIAAKNVRGPAPSGFDESIAVVNSTREDHSADFSPDGERIAFVSTRSGNQEIWVARRNGSEAVALTSLRAFRTGSPHWSPDGRRIVFDSWASGTSAIYVVDSAGGVPRMISSGAWGSWMPSWSPNGEWIYFSRGLTGAQEIWKIPAAGGDAIQVTHSGAFEAHPSPDGGSIYFSKQPPQQGSAIWSVPASGGIEKSVPELQSFHSIGRCWGTTEQGIYFISYEDSPRQTVRFLSFQSHKVTVLFSLPKQIQWGVSALSLSRDGRYAMAAQYDHAVNDLSMIENFR